jgi:hypothetical protein
MLNVMDPAIALPLALIFFVAAGAIWYVFVRPVPLKTATGIITDCNFRAAETVQRSIPRTIRSLEYTPQDIHYTVPDRHVYRIRLDGNDTEVYFTAAASNLPPLDVGRAVRLVYIERYIPLIGRRAYVKEMTAT